MIKGVKLPDQAKVVIIGGGVAGCSLAYRLAERGCKDILVLEKGEIASGSSHKAAGYMSHIAMNEPGVVVQKLAWPLYDKFQKQGDIELHECPLLVPVREKDPAVYNLYFRDLANKIAPKLDWGGWIQYLDSPEKVTKIIPDLKTKNIRNLGNLIAGLYTPKDVWVDPYLLTMTYAKHARRMGVDIRTRVEVTGITVQGGKVRGVETNAGKVNCDYVVCAAGAWSSKIGKMVGLEIPIKPVRRLLFKILPNKEKKYRMGHMLDELESYTTRMGLWIRDDVVGYVGAGSHGIKVFDADKAVDPDDYDENYQYEDLMDFADKLEEFLPRFGEFEVLDGWAGLYEVTIDGTFIIDKVEDIEGFILDTGFCGEGIHVSGGASVLAAELILDGKIHSVKDPGIWGYNMQRFPEL